MKASIWNKKPNEINPNANFACRDCLRIFWTLGSLKFSSSVSPESLLTPNTTACFFEIIKSKDKMHDPMKLIQSPRSVRKDWKFIFFLLTIKLKRLLGIKIFHFQFLWTYFTDYLLLDCASCITSDSSWCLLRRLYSTLLHGQRPFHSTSRSCSYSRHAQWRRVDS